MASILQVLYTVKFSVNMFCNHIIMPTDMEILKAVLNGFTCYCKNVNSALVKLTAGSHVVVVLC